MRFEKPKGMPDKVWECVQDLKDEEWEERFRAARKLGEIKHESAVPFLIRALKDESINVRGRAAYALGKIKHENAVKPLIKALKDKNIGVRWNVAEALGRIKHENAVKPLTKALKDKSWEVRRQAAEALFAIGEFLVKKQEKGEKLTPKGEKLLKAVSLIKPHFTKNQKGEITESPEVQAQALHYAYNDKKGEINENNARLFIKQLRAMQGNLK